MQAMQNKMVYVDGPDMSVNYVFRKFGWTPTTEVDEADLICLTGGADICPQIYGETPLPEVYTAPSRDKRELALVEHNLKRRNVPIAGICRGGQLLNCLAGGTLWQDMDGHGSSHPAVDVATGQTYIVSSLHHQAMRPTPEAQVLLLADEASFAVSQHDSWWKAKDDPHPRDIEALYYPKQRWFCFQGHPEYDPEGDTGRLFFEYIDNLIELN